MRHKRDTEEAEEVRREAHNEMENRKHRHAHTSRQIKAEKKVLTDAETALYEATRICDEHKAKSGLSEPVVLKGLQKTVTDYQGAVDARQGLVKILREQQELIQRGMESEESDEDLAKRTAELERSTALPLLNFTKERVPLSAPLRKTVDAAALSWDDPPN